MKDQTVYVGMIELDTLFAKIIKRFEIKSFIKFVVSDLSQSFTPLEW